MNRATPLKVRRRVRWENAGSGDDGCSFGFQLPATTYNHQVDSKDRLQSRDVSKKTAKVRTVMPYQSKMNVRQGGGSNQADGDAK